MICLIFFVLTIRLASEYNSKIFVNLIRWTIELYTIVCLLSSNIMSQALTLPPNSSKTLSGVSFLYNADVMTSALFRTSKNSELSFHATCINFGKIFQLKNTSVFHFHGFRCVSMECWHVSMCTNSKSQITLSCSNFNTVVHKGEIQRPPPVLHPLQFAQNALV